MISASRRWRGPRASRRFSESRSRSSGLALGDCRYVALITICLIARFTKQAGIETQVEVEVPGLLAEAGSAAETLALKLTRSNRTVAVSYATEAGHFQQAGMPTIVCGPGSIDQAHQPDEYIEEGEIVACIGFMRRLAGELGAG